MELIVWLPDIQAWFIALVHDTVNLTLFMSKSVEQLCHLQKKSWKTQFEAFCSVVGLEMLLLLVCVVGAQNKWLVWEHSEQ